MTQNDMLNQQVSALKERRYHNQGKKEESQDNYDDNYRKFVNSNETLLQHQNNICASLPDQSVKEAAIRERREVLDDIDLDKNEMDLDDPRSEIDELELDREKIEAQVKLTDRIDSIIRDSLGNQGPDYGSLKSKRDEMAAKAEESLDEHIANVQEGLDINRQLEEIRGADYESSIESSSDDGANDSGDGGNNGSGSDSGGGNGSGSVGDDSTAAEGGNTGGSGSLVDDYADPSQDMPSYMDPED